MAIGFTHYRPFPRPILASMGCYLDDLYVTADARGQGVAGALLQDVQQRAREEGWDVVRWATGPENHTAIALYDRVAHRTHRVTYDLPVEEA